MPIPDFSNYELEELGEEEACMFAKSALLGLERRTPGDLAPMEVPTNGSRATGFYIVFIQIPEASKKSYFEVVRSYRSWLEGELDHSQSVRYTPSFHVGNFSDELLLKIRQRPEVGLVVVDSELSYAS